jgi:hypothetical protein
MAIRKWCVKLIGADSADIQRFYWRSMTPSYPVGLIWLRRDLRLADNAALYHALQQCEKLYCVFVFDDSILAALPRADRRVEFICQSLAELDAALRETSGRPQTGLITRRACPRTSSRPWPGSWARAPSSATTTTSRRHCPRRPGGAQPQEPGAVAAALQGPPHLCARRGADPEPVAVFGLHALQERLAAEGHALLPRPTPASAISRPGWPICRTPSAARFPRLRIWALPRTRWPACACPPASAAPASCWPIFCRACRSTRRRATFRPSRAQLPQRASALWHRLDTRAGPPRPRGGAQRGLVCRGARRRGHLAQRADLARLLLPDPGPPALCRGAQLQACV